MDEIEITIFDEVNNYKEKIYFLNLRQWIFAILICLIVIPTYLFLKNKVGENLASYVVIAISGILGFIGFVKIHDLTGEKIIPYWIRHYFIFNKPIHYIPDKEYELQHQKKNHLKNKFKSNAIYSKQRKLEKKEVRKKQKREYLLKKAKKKYGIAIDSNKKQNTSQDELNKRLSKLTNEQKEALLKILKE